MVTRPATPPSTNGLAILCGDPKKAILKLSIPMIVAMTVQTLYNLVNAIWVSGLGADALASVGFVFPFLFMSTAIATGLGIGGGSAISRKIGEKDKKGADITATHTILLNLVVAVIFTIPMIVFAEPLFRLLGAGATTETATVYAQILFGASIISFFNLSANAVLRSEGDAKRAMFAILLGGVLNIFLDPVFIYVFGLGVPGAAWASNLSMGVTALLLLYWIYGKKNTYLSVPFRGFRFKSAIIKDILQVGIPASLMQLSISILMLLMNLILVVVGGTDAVAVFSAGWRIATIASMPLLGMATAVVSVTGTAFGAKEYGRLGSAFRYSIKLGLGIEITIAVLTYIFASAIALVFTTSEMSAHLSEPLVSFLQVVCIYYPTVALGILSSALFQGIGKGFNSLVVTILRTIILVAPLAWFFAVDLGWGLIGAAWGLVIGNILGSVVSYSWAYVDLRRLERQPAAVSTCDTNV